MATNFMTIDTQHSDMIHDAELDYYGTLLATCSSDEKIKIYKASKQPYQLLCEIPEHHGPVWQVSWSYPTFGNILASCSYDATVKIFNVPGDGTYSTLYTYDSHKASVNSIAWAPREFGLCLACASSDGHISIIYRNDANEWQTKMISVSGSSCNAVSWAPFRHIGSVDANNNTIMRLVVASSDNNIYIFKCKQNGGDWEIEHKLQNHTEWVRDVSWSNYTGVPYNLIASCGKDNKLYIWCQKSSTDKYESVLVNTFDCPVWKLSWSLTGNLLAVSSGTQQVTIWKESFEGQWECISDSLNETTN